MRLVSVLLLAVLVFVACGGSEETATSDAETTTLAATTPAPTSTAELATTPAPTSTAEPATTPAPTSTAEPATTTTVSAERLAAAAAVGDIAAGEQLFNEPLDGINHSASCASCHTLDGLPARNPTFVGIGAVAGERISGMSDVEYLRASIVDPYAFTPDGDWQSSAMPYRYPDLLSEDQINNVIAYMLTQ